MFRKAASDLVLALVLYNVSYKGTNYGVITIYSNGQFMEYEAWWNQEINKISIVYFQQKLDENEMYQIPALSRLSL